MTLKTLAAAIAFVSVIAAQPARAAIVLVDNFDSESQATTYTGFDNWTVSSGSVDLIGTGFSDFYPGNGNYVDLNGSSGTNGQIRSNTAFGAGTYTLSFLLGGSQGGAAGVDLPNPKTTVITLGSFTTSITLEPTTPLSSYEFTFTTTGGNLFFTSLAGGHANVGNILDNVQLATAAPELSTWAMMLIGFAGIGFLAWRRTKMAPASI